MNMDKDKFEFVHSKALTKKEKKFYVNLYKQLCCLIDDEYRKKGNNKQQRMKALQDNLYKVIKQYPELLYINRYILESEPPFRTGSYYYTFLYELMEYDLYELIEKLCDDVEVCKLTTCFGRPLIYWLIPKDPHPDNYQFDIDCYNKKIKSVLSILEKHPELLYFQDNEGYNLAGRIISQYSNGSKYLKPFIPYILDSIKDSLIAEQQTKKGYNLGMLCAYYKHQELFEIAYNNTKARMQKNNAGDTMEMIANNNGLIIPPLSDEQIYDFYNEIISKKIDDICK